MVKIHATERILHVRPLQNLNDDIHGARSPKPRKSVAKRRKCSPATGIQLNLHQQHITNTSSKTGTPTPSPGFIPSFSPGVIRVFQKSTSQPEGSTVQRDE